LFFRSAEKQKKKLWEKKTAWGKKKTGHSPGARKKGDGVPSNQKKKTLQLRGKGVTFYLEKGGKAVLKKPPKNRTKPKLPPNIGGEGGSAPRKKNRQGGGFMCYRGGNLR